VRFANFFIRSLPKRIFSIRGGTKFLCVRLLEKKGFFRISYVGRTLWPSEANPLIFQPTQLGKFYLFEWLAARGRFFEIVTLILQLIIFLDFLFTPYKYRSLWCLPVAWPRRKLLCIPRDI
jgi:hypothetical protein